MNYQKITKFDTANGVGVRVTLWVSGCTHYCKGCHNPQTWGFTSGQEFDDTAWNTICEMMENPVISGLTVSGGDPLNPKNVQTVERVVRNTKLLYPNKNIWMYTGYRLNDLLNSDNPYIIMALHYTDILVDGKYRKRLKDISYPWAGSENQHIWRNIGHDKWEMSEYEKEYRDAKNRPLIYK